MAKKQAEDNDTTMLCESITGKGCGLKKIIGIIGGKWKILILCYIDAKGIGRFGEMKRTIYGITNTMLASSLKEMEADHYTAWSKGGATDISNCCMLCKHHNLLKGNK